MERGEIKDLVKKERINQREIVLNILRDFEQGIDLNISLDKFSHFSKQEFGFIKSVSFGTVRYKLQLDYIIKKLSKIKFERIDDDILNILRMSLFQLLYMKHVPESAVVNEAVKLSKKYNNKSLASFVNGNLRNFLRKKYIFSELPKSSMLEKLSIKYSFPKWILEEIIDSFGMENLENILSKLNEPSSFVIRANTILIDRNSLKKELEEHGFKTTYGKKAEDSLILDNPNGLFDTNLYKEGYFYVQSESSQLVGEIAVGNGNYSRVLDMCASPGGKITHVYQLQSGKGEYYALDVSEEKNALIKENCSRLTHKNINVFVNDGTVYNNKFKEKFDLIIVDAPCSALGLIAKFPQIKYSRTKNDLKALSNIQGKILENAGKYLRPNGKLLYSTCTFTKLENDDLIEKFLDKNIDFKLDGEIRRVSPLDFDSDIFTIAVVRKNG